MRGQDRIDAMLDHALEMTFPASDPFTIYFPEIKTGYQDGLPEVQRELEVVGRPGGRERKHDNPLQ